MLLYVTYEAGKATAGACVPTSRTIAFDEQGMTTMTSTHATHEVTTKLVKTHDRVGRITAEICNGRRIEFDSPLPPDLERLVASL